MPPVQNIAIFLCETGLGSPPTRPGNSPKLLGFGVDAPLNVPDCDLIVVAEYRSLATCPARSVVFSTAGDRHSAGPCQRIDVGLPPCRHDCVSARNYSSYRKGVGGGAFRPLQIGRKPGRHGYAQSPRRAARWAGIVPFDAFGGAKQTCL